jgi:transposase InsO family protein
VITEIHAASRGTYGVRRIRAALSYERGLAVNRKIIGKLMRDAGLSGLPGKKPVHVATHEDFVNRDFTASSPNRLSLTDVTQHNTREGTHYCCVVLDLFSRRVVGWAIERRNDAALVNEALFMAARERATSNETIAVQRPRFGLRLVVVHPKPSASRAPRLDGDRRGLLR